MTRMIGMVGALLLMAGAAQAQTWNRDWEERLEARLERISRVVERAVSRTVDRAVERQVQIQLQAGWDHVLDYDWDRHWDRAWDEHWDGRFDHHRREGEDRGPFTSQETFTWEGRVDRGRTVEIKGVNGPVRAEAAAGDRVEVVAEKRGRRDDPDDVRIEVVEHGGGVTVCAVYPRGRDRRENRCGPGREGRISSQDNDVQVTFRVRVPEGVNFSGRTVNGDVEIRDLTADALAYTVNGSVELSTSGGAEARTVNGSIDAAFGRLSRGVEFETVNGTIELDVPDDVNADLEAKWLNGGIESDLPLTLRGRLSKREARGTLGGGGPLIQVSTVNGSIRIR